ncbi:hypothetical protein RJT34_32038 [Clitoria ternatea]|uniref:Uncharacterized protein n=1 Tax=Clitoria ternatea TaxID=43366 RepID=A0AAN9I453_CLITE
MAIGYTSKHCPLINPCHCQTRHSKLPLNAFVSFRGQTAPFHDFIVVLSTLDPGGRGTLVIARFYSRRNKYHSLFDEVLVSLCVYPSPSSSSCSNRNRFSRCGW